MRYNKVDTMSLIPSPYTHHLPYPTPSHPAMNPYLSAAYIQYYRYVAPTLITPRLAQGHLNHTVVKTSPNSHKFSIDSLLGLRHDTGDIKSEPQTLESPLDYTNYRHPAESNPRSEYEERETEAEGEYSWLQCSRYRPPKLSRSRKEGAKKRKLGRNPRVPFSQHQVAVMEDKFRNTHYLSSSDVLHLALTLHLTETRVKIWFQNRRARERRDIEARERHKLVTEEQAAAQSSQQPHQITTPPHGTPHPITTPPRGTTHSPNTPPYLTTNPHTEYPSPIAVTAPHADSTTHDDVINAPLLVPKLVKTEQRDVAPRSPIGSSYGSGIAPRSPIGSSYVSVTTHGMTFRTPHSPIYSPTFQHNVA